MSYIGSFSRMLFGGTDSYARASGGKNHQTVAELLTATTSRVLHGPRHNAHYSLHVVVGAGTAPVGTLTVWYSNLPDPDPDNDAHWVQDTAIASVDLSVAAGTFLNIGNVSAQHIRLKATRTSGTISLIVWARAEGSD